MGATTNKFMADITKLRETCQRDLDKILALQEANLKLKLKMKPLTDAITALANKHMPGGNHTPKGEAALVADPLRIKLDAELTPIYDMSTKTLEKIMDAKDALGAAVKPLHAENIKFKAYVAGKKTKWNPFKKKSVTDADAFVLEVETYIKRCSAAADPTH